VFIAGTGDWRTAKASEMRARRLWGCSPLGVLSTDSRRQCGVEIFAEAFACLKDLASSAAIEAMACVLTGRSRARPGGAGRCGRRRGLRMHVPVGDARALSKRFDIWPRQEPSQASR